MYVGVSAGSVVATPNLTKRLDAEAMGLCLVNAYISVHCVEVTAPSIGLVPEHVTLTDSQALAVNWAGYELVEA